MARRRWLWNETAKWTSIGRLDGVEATERSRQAEALDGWFAQMRLGERVLPIDEPIAEAWARMSVPDPLPLIDGLLAATAKVHGLTLVMRNVGDVARTGISVVDPFGD